MGKKSKDKKKKSSKKFKGNLIETIQNVHFMYERKLDNTFAEFDLSNEQFRILQILNSAPNGEYSLKEIREALPNQTSNATRLVEKLRLKKLLVKKSSKEDKRALRISLTPEGISALEAAEDKIMSINSDLKKLIDAKSGKAALKVLENLSNLLVEDNNN